MCTSSVDRDPFELLAEEFAERLRRGEHPSLTEYIARCPDRAADIRELFPALALVERNKPSADGPAVPFAAVVPPVAAGVPDRLGDYRILRYLGEGGMGVVYEAVRESLRSHVALKVMHPQLRDRDKYLRRFRTEARSAARLHHTNIVSVFDYGIHDGVCYYAMQYIAGHSLDKILEDIRQIRLQETDGLAAAEDTVAQVLDRVLLEIGRLRCEKQDSAAGPDAIALVESGEHRVALGNSRPQADPQAIDSGRRSAITGLLTGRYPRRSHAEEPEDSAASDPRTTPAPAAGMSEERAAFANGAASRASESEPTEVGPIRLGVAQPDDPVGMTLPLEPPTEGSGSADSSVDGSASTLARRTDERYYREVARLGVQIAEALAYAHQRGVLHRDIKPPNLILDPLGNIWITDFGLAKSDDGDDLSQSHDLVGTLRYMAPERFRGVSTAQCDIYALGATLYEMMTLRPPFRGKDQLQLIRQVEHDPPVPPREIDRRIPRDLETIVLKALAKNPADRFASARAMADELRRYLENRPIQSRPIPAYQHVWRWCKRNPGFSAACLTAAAMVVVLAIGSTVAAWTFRGQNDQIKQHLGELNDSHRQLLAANSDGQKKLFQAYYDRARAQRYARHEGQRFRSLEALKEATRIGRELRLPPEAFEPLRDEAIACLALPDLEPTGQVLTRSSEAVSVQFDATLSRYALLLRDGTLSVRQVADEREIARFPVGGVREIYPQLSPDGRYLAVEDPSERTRKFWDIERRAVTLDISPPRVRVTLVQFAPDGRRLLVATDDGSFLWYELATGHLVRSYRGPGQVRAMAIRSDGGRIAALYQDKTCRIIDTETGELIRTFSIPLRDAGSVVAWSSDGATLATSADDNRIHLWEAATGIRRATLEGHVNAVTVVQFHPAGGQLLSHGWEGRIWLWDPVRGRPWLNCNGTLGAGFTGDGRTVIGRDDQWAVYRVDPALEYRSFAHASGVPNSYHRPSIRHDGRVLAVGTATGVILWDLARWTELAFLPIGNAWHSTFEPSGDLLTSGTLGVQRWPIRLDPGRGEFRIGPPKALPLPASLCAIDEDRSGRIVALANHIFAHVATPERTGRVGPLDDCRNVSVSPDGRWLATNSFTGSRARVWRISDLQEVADIPLDERTSIVFSPDGTHFVTSKSPSQLWEVGTWHRVSLIGGGFGSFSPDGRMVLTRDASPVLRLAETATGRTLARFENPDSSHAGWAIFSPDGSRLVTTTPDGPAVHVWDLRAIRRHLAGMGLDWVAPPFPETDPAAESSRGFSNIVVDPGPYKPELLPLLEQAARLEDSGDVGGAIDRLRQAVRVSPAYALAHNNLAWLLLTAPNAHRNLDEAIRHARRAVELQPGEQVSLNTLGVALYRAGRFADTIETLEKSLAAGKGGLAAFDLFFLAMAHHRLGHVDQARLRLDEAKRWMDARRNILHPDHLKELSNIRAEAEAVLAGPSVSELPDDVFAEPRR